MRKMTKQEQIEEMAKYICNVCEMGNGFNGDCSEGGTDFYKRCTLTQETAKALYDAGYRIIKEKNETLQERNGLKAENRQLKTECALLDDELRIARRDTIDVLNKVKDYVNQLACDEYGDSACDTNYITIDIDKYEQDIDEMIEELLKNAEN